MENPLKAKEEFQQRLEELQEEIQPMLTDNTTKEVVIYEKLLEIQDQLNKLALKLEKNKL